MGERQKTPEKRMVKRLAASRVRWSLTYGDRERKAESMGQFHRVSSGAWGQEDDLWSDCLVSSPLPFT